MHVLLTGTSGFVGHQILKELLSSGNNVTALVHTKKGATELLQQFSGLKIEVADVSDRLALSALAQGLIGTEAIIYLPGLLREFPRKGITFQKVHVDGVQNLLAFAKEIGVKRWLQMSALGVKPNATTGYFETKWAAEELVRSSGMDWTIFRPSVIFSDEPSTRINFVGELAKVLKSSPVIPIFGDGKYRMQPVALKVVARSMVRSLVMPETFSKVYELGGPQKLEYQELLLEIANAQGRSKPIVHIPFLPVEFAAKLFDRFPFFPLTRDQLTMLKEENIVHDPTKESEFNDTFHLEQIALSEGLRGYFGLLPQGLQTPPL